jgi:hypothetical protein
MSKGSGLALGPARPVAREHGVQINTDMCRNVVQHHLVEKSWHCRRDLVTVWSLGYALNRRLGGPRFGGENSVLHWPGIEPESLACHSIDCAVTPGNFPASLIE